MLLAVLVADRLGQYQRQLRWQKVRELTGAAIAAHLCDALSEVFVYFPILDDGPMARVLRGRNEPNADTAAGISHMGAQLREIPSAVSAEKSSSDCAVEYYSAVKWDIDQVRDVLIPRLIESSADQDLIDSAVAFDQAARDLYTAVTVHQRVVTHGVLPDFLALVDKARGVYETLLASWTET